MFTNEIKDGRKRAKSLEKCRKTIFRLVCLLHLKELKNNV